MINRVMIVGQKWLGAEVFKLCRQSGLQVAAVACPSLDDRLAVTASANAVPVVLAPKRLCAEHIPIDVDLLICAHAHCFVGADARKSTKLGAIGYHPSLLPRHRGRDAIRWAIHMQEAITGGTVYWLDDGADTGPIAAQDWCWIRPNDTPDMLWRRDLAPMGLRLLKGVLTDLLNGKDEAVLQDSSLSTWEPAFTVKALSSG